MQKDEQRRICAFISFLWRVPCLIYIVMKKKTLKKKKKKANNKLHQFLFKFCL